MFNVEAERLRLQILISRLRRLITEYSNSLTDNQFYIDRYANIIAELSERITITSRRIPSPPPLSLRELVRIYPGFRAYATEQQRLFRELAEYRREYERRTLLAALARLTRSRAAYLGYLRQYRAIKEGLEFLRRRAEEDLARAIEDLRKLPPPVIMVNGWEITKYFRYEPSDIKGWRNQREFEVKGELFFPADWSEDDVSTYVFIDHEVEMEKMFDDVLWEAIMNNMQTGARIVFKRDYELLFDIEQAMQLMEILKRDIRWGGEVTSTGRVSTTRAETVDFTVIDKSRHEHYHKREYTTSRRWTVP